MPRRKGKKLIQSKKVSYAGYEFDSITEAEYYKHLLQQDDIDRIEVHPQYVLLEAFNVPCSACFGTGKVKSAKTGNDVQCRKCKGESVRNRQGTIYTPDFEITYKNGEKRLVDVKGGKVNESFGLRKKLFENRYGIELVVIKWGKKKGFYQYR